MVLRNHKKIIGILGAVIVISVSGILGNRVWRGLKTLNEQKEKEPVITERYVRPEQIPREVKTGDLSAECA